MLKLFISHSLLLLSLFSIGQTEYKKYPRIMINNSENEIAPCLSMDGNTMIFCRKRAMEEDWMTQIVYKTNGDWGRPMDLMLLNELPKLRDLGSYALNSNGTEILFVTKKSGGLGSYDIWSTEFKGNKWHAPQNLGNPLNTKLDEVSPCFSLDNKSIYFIRKESSAENGKVFISERKSGFCSTPVELPFIGLYASVRIAADNQTIYLSKIVDGKTQLYVSKLVKSTWSNPVQIKDIDENLDKNFTLDYQSNLITISTKKEDSYDIYYTKLEKEFSATNVSVLNYTIDKPVKIIIQEKETDKNIFLGNSLENLYLNNDKEYTFFFIYRDFYPQVLDINLIDAPSSQQTLQLPFKSIAKGQINILKEFDSTYDFKSEKKYYSNYLNALKLTAEAHPKTKFDLVYFQNDIKSDSVSIDSTILTNSPKPITSFDNSKQIVSELRKIGTTLKIPLNINFTCALKSPEGALKPKGFYIVTH
jgi:hypothetical protein